ncbi:MAG: hypothetical protein JNK12_07900 [Acidimicrobiales bacterium]|nr:hypothetical protein [Acidimicrobiales bacterium]
MAHASRFEVTGSSLFRFDLEQAEDLAVVDTPPACPRQTSHGSALDIKWT